MHVAKRLLDRGDTIFGIDNLNDYYDVSLKLSRLDNLESQSGFTFEKCDISNLEAVTDVFENQFFDAVIHLAAQAGVRFSITNPNAYISANIQGFMNILEGCRHQQIKHLIYASSSSVYGGNTTMPFSEHHSVDHPVSLYATTKKTNELMAHTYSHLFGIPTTGLRFFTVYGPWGRPDMALFMFTKAILAGQSIDVFNNGKMVRDFTFIDDIVSGVVGVVDKVAVASEAFDPGDPSPALSNVPFRIFNIGNGKPTPLMAYISAIEDVLGITAKLNMLPIQLGDVPATAARTDELKNWIGFESKTSVNEGVKHFVDWYLKHYQITA